MSLENQEQHGLNQHAEARPELEKKLIYYTREFLLSLRELDICKNLPSGIDQSILSEFEDTSQDRFRISGSLSSQSYRRNDYGSSPPTRGDISNHSRGIHGRWDSPSSGKSDHDSDTQSDWDSDSRKRYGNQSRRPWQVPEHDGLLGSGSFPRPSGYAAGASAPKFQANDQYHLNRSSEPYHPPRPYKAVPHLRRDTHDTYNDETFGSSECTSEDRVEEERKRRASFELMRKEQHKASQEKWKLNPQKGKDDFDISELMEDPKDDKRFMIKKDESDAVVTQPPSNTDSDKPSFPSPAPVARPLVPPGFSSTIVEKNIGMKSSIHPQPSEIGNEHEGSHLHSKGNILQSGTSSNQEEKQSSEQIDSREQQLRSPNINVAVNQSEKILNLSSALDVSSEAVGVDSQYYKSSKLSAAFETSENSEVIELGAKRVTGSEVMGESSPTRSSSILSGLFGTVFTLNDVGSSGFIEHEVKADETCSPHNVPSSKFAQWFLEEEKKPINDLVSGRPSDLLSLIVGEKSGSQALDAKAIENITPSLPLQSSGVTDGHMTSNSTPVKNIDKLDTVPAVLTCEDLELSILSEITENGSILQPSVGGLSDSGAKIKQQKADINDHASHHLLSLLQKGTGLSTDLEIISSDTQQYVEAENLGAKLSSSREIYTENIHNAGKPLTLETLFGTAFMKELQPVGTPTSGQRGLTESMRANISEFPFPVMDDDILASTYMTSGMSTQGGCIIASNQRQKMKSESTEEKLLGFDRQEEVDSLQHQKTELGSIFGGFDGSVEIQLPEEDSLITASNSISLQNFMPAWNSSIAELLSTPETAVDISNKLAALNSVYREEGPIVGGKEGGAFFHGPYDMSEPDHHYTELHAQPSSPQLHHPRLNHAGQVFHSLDSHPANMNAQMKFMASENLHQDPPNHQFPANFLRPPFHHSSTGSTGFGPNPHNAMLQQMHMPGNFPPPHLLRGFSRGAPVSPHPNNQVPSFLQEPNPMQGLPFGQRQINFGGVGISPLGKPLASDVGGGKHHPEALQRLVEMELRSKSKPIHPFAMGGHGQRMYGHELDNRHGFWT
ncbi:uncharacterized protein LOC110615149 isoform X2 [Manihot esculenta]|uniref:uncharacterized protein LOC110615149 isoform X2 n=1 Tax=Manihot esculenta TaxID=3983 RepID=UPI000B5D3FB9|nr:uncharacterized protein LOC110615149 isoform X2 [Manihot esculenta]